MLTIIILSLLVEVTLLWLLSIQLKNASIIDIFWGLGYINVVIVSGYWRNFDLNSVQWATALLVGAWGTRLSIHLAIRNIGKGEDYRYGLMRAKGGDHWWLQSYITVFLFQAGLIVLISLPIIWIFSSDVARSFNALEYVAVSVWLIGFLLEAMADHQLSQFKRKRCDSRQVLDYGVWRYSRHPNYFGDALQWWGISLLALPLTSGWITLLSPITMTFFLLKVSGVAMLEKELIKSKPEYSRYVARTSAFIPWWPKNVE